MAAEIFGVHDFVRYKGQFPQHRVERLMNLDRNCGLTSRVLFEGPFIELSADGLPVQQVFLGLTSEELIIVKQEISFDINVTDRSDLELEGLFIDAIFQLSDISISVSQNVSRTFSVTVPGRMILTFEMCKLDPGYRAQWNTWHNILSESVDHRQVSNNSVKTSSSETLESRQNVVPVTSNGAGESSSSDSDMGISSADSYDLNSDPTRFGAELRRRLAFMYGGNPIHFMSMNGCDRMQTKPVVVKSASWSDVTSERSLSRVDITSLLKLLQKRDKLNSKIFSSESFYDSWSDTSEEDEEDIDTMFHEARVTQERQGNKRSGAHLWCMAKQRVLGNSKGSFKRYQLEKALDYIFLQTLSARKKPIERNIVDFRPFEVAQELTIMSRKLLLTIRPSDLEECRNMSSLNTPMCLKRLAIWGNTIRKFVAAEIISNRVLSDRVTTLKLFIDVCYDLLFTKRDFQSLIYVLRGMTSLPVYRLQNTWATLFVQEPLTFSQFQAMASVLSPAGCYKSYRTRVGLCNARNSSYVPWFDHFMVHCNKKNDLNARLVLTTRPVMAAQKVCPSIPYLNKQTDDFTKHDTKKARFVNRNARKKVQPLFLPIGSTTPKPPKSILKLQENRKKQNGIPRVLGMIGLRKCKKVKFLLSGDHVERSETNSSIIKHLDKTRFYPTDLSNDSEPDTTLFADNHRDLNQRLVDTSAIEKYCEQKSKEIIYETYKSIATNLSRKEKHLIDDTPLKGHECWSNDVDREQEGEFDNIKQGIASDSIKANGQEITEKAKSRKNKPVAMIKKTYKKFKDKRRTRKDIKHVNYLQSEIDSINDMLKEFEHMKDDDVDIHEENITNKVKDAPSGQDQTNAWLAATNDERPSKEMGDTAERRNTRRKSYIPASVVENRRMSLFEQAFDDNKDKAIDKVFSRSMEMRLKGLQGRRKSVAMELLEEDETLGLEKGSNQNSCNNAEIPHRDFCLKSCSLENLGISCVEYTGCMYCDGETCIYSESIHDHLAFLQTNAISSQECSSERVRECLKIMMKAARSLSNFDLMALSFSRE